MVYRDTTSAPKEESYLDMARIVPARRRSPRILVVDDNPDVVLLMQELLASRGYDAVAVSDAVEAEAQIRREPPDLILLDVVMPGKSGYEICREIKESSVTRLIPVVVLEPKG